MAKTDWLTENPEAAYRYMRAFDDGLKHFRENSEDAITRFGRLAGLEGGEIDTVQELVDERVIFQDEWNEEYIDSLWMFFEQVHELGHIEAVPEKSEHTLLPSELAEMADQ